MVKLTLILLLLSVQFTFAQKAKIIQQLEKSGISKLEGTEFYYSKGSLEKAIAYHELISQQLGWIGEWLPMDLAPPTVAILSEVDLKGIKELRKSNYPTWLNKKYQFTDPQKGPRFYGHTIVIAANTDGKFKDKMLGMGEKIRSVDRHGIVEGFGGLKQTVELSFDLILFHELGHYLMDEYGIYENRDLEWANEFFANLFAYACMKESNPGYAQIWELFGQLFLDESLSDYQSLAQLNDNCQPGTSARTVMQSLLFFKAVDCYNKDGQILEKMVADDRLKKENNWASLMSILDSHIPDFSRIEGLELD